MRSLTNDSGDGDCEGNHKDGCAGRQIFELATELPADCVACCPSRRDLAACGTYAYDEARRVRSGTVSLLHVTAGQPPRLLATSDIISGVFELCWRRHAGQVKGAADGPPSLPPLACAAADGLVHLFRAEVTQVADSQDPTRCAIVREGVINLFPDDLADADGDLHCLCADWEGDRLAASFTNGKVALVDTSESLETAVVECSWDAHRYPDGSPAEVWACALGGQSDPFTVFSGADDSLLKRWDKRVPGTVPTGASRRMEAGVCCIRTVPTAPPMLITGSYDSRARLWDTRKLQHAVSTSSDLGGGVWRVAVNVPEPALDQSQVVQVVCACMRGGFRRLELDLASGTWEKKSMLTGGESNDDWEALAYGVDIVGATDSGDIGSCKDGCSLVAGCSFYDNRFRVMEFRH